MARPTLVRYSIVGLAMTINMLCYTDRVCIAVAGPRIRSELGLSQAQLGLVFSIFFLAYAAAQAPWGMLADRFGSRGIVTAAIFCWSGFTASFALFISGSWTRRLSAMSCTPSACSEDEAWVTAPAAAPSDALLRPGPAGLLPMSGWRARQGRVRRREKGRPGRRSARCF